MTLRPDRRVRGTETSAPAPANTSPARSAFLLRVRMLFEVGDNVRHLVVFLQAGKSHLVAFDKPLSGLQVFCDVDLVLDEAAFTRLNHRLGIFEAPMGSGFPADYARRGPTLYLASSTTWQA